jgi:hypothetical protein
MLLQPRSEEKKERKEAFVHLFVCLSVCPLFAVPAHLCELKRLGGGGGGEEKVSFYVLGT